MKKISLFVLILIFSVNSFAQVIYSEPEFPTENDSIIIYFDATQADDKDLVGYTGDLYAHTGLKTNQGEWRYVIEEWGWNDTQPKLTRIATDLYKLVIGYPREFYPIINESEMISGLNFVFRSADAKKQTENIFVEIYDDGFSVIVTNPVIEMLYGDPLRSPCFANAGDTVLITVTTTSDPDSILLFQDDLLLSKSTETELSYNYICTDVIGAINFTAIGYTEDEIDRSEFIIFVNPEMNEEALPENIKPGVNFRDDGSAILAIFAPYKKFIYLIGGGNDWKVDENYFMKKYSPSEDSVIFWYKFDNIISDKVYQYQYLIDGDLRIGDPYTEMILDPGNDKYITAATFPNMPEYPEDKTSEAVSTFQKKSSEFQWTDNNYQKPDKEKLVIYELLVRDFSEKHSYNGVLEKLDYLDSLGINAIELLPINEFEGNSSWGYNPSFYFAVDKYYGTPDDLRTFVNECHNRGIAVIGDMVLNHSFGQSPIVRMYWNNSKRRPAANNPWYNEEHNFANPAAHWGYDFNHESVHTEYFIDRVVKYWLSDFHFDGYRFDFTKGFSNTPYPLYGDNNWGSRYDAARVQNLKRMTNEMWKVDSNAYAIFEHLSDNDEEKVLSDHGIMLWGNLNEKYNEASMGWNSGTKSDFSWGYFKNHGWTEPNLITYMESHDEERMMFKNQEHGNKSGSYDIKHQYTALQRQKLVNAFFLTIPGPKMIWQFGELGYDFEINYNGRVGEKPVRWDYYEDENRRNLYKTIKALIELRRDNDVFTSKNTSVTQNLSGNIKQVKLGGSVNVLIAGNFGVNAEDVALNFVHGGDWYEYFSGDTTNISVSLTKNLKPGEFHIYSDKKFKTPVENILVKIDRDDLVLDKFILYPPHPNPFNPSTNISFNLPKQSDVKLYIYNILGEIVYNKTYIKQNKGYHTINWNTLNDDKNNSSGVYFIQLYSGNIVSKCKVLLIK